ncbi:dUTP diphosphatase [Patescibacteria group bacterium]|nr:dUTP diphosphatase [Patescibacteria group bacterium]
MKIKIQKINEEAIIPFYAHKGDAGMDIFSIEEKIIKPKERVLISTGLKFEIPIGYEMQIRPKSGLALNYGITVLNTPGTIDAGYRGELKVILFNSSREDYLVSKGTKVAQAIIAKVEEAEIEEVEDICESSRGDGGFGSTGLVK